MIEITGLKRTYHAGDTEVRALRGIDLSINAGEFLAIAGPSGSGKTTLLNLIGCIDEPDEGTVTFRGEDVHAGSRKERARFRRNHLGFVFQSFNLIPVLTAEENVALSLSLLNLPGDEIHSRVARSLHEVGLDGMADRRPSRLSGGQQQRVAVARALVKDPAVVLADEPTANLDSDTGETILELMHELNRLHGTTFIFSTHDPMVMEKADRLVRLQDGRVISDERRNGRDGPDGDGLGRAVTGGVG